MGCYWASTRRTSCSSGVPVWTPVPTVTAAAACNPASRPNTCCGAARCGAAHCSAGTTDSNSGATRFDPIDGVLLERWGVSGMLRLLSERWGVSDLGEPILEDEYTLDMLDDARLKMIDSTCCATSGLSVASSSRISSARSVSSRCSSFHLSLTTSTSAQCVCVNMYIYMRARAHTRTQTHIHTSARAHTRTRTRTHTGARICTGEA